MEISLGSIIQPFHGLAGPAESVRGFVSCTDVKVLKQFAKTTQDTSSFLRNAFGFMAMTWIFRKIAFVHSKQPEFDALAISMREKLMLTMEAPAPQDWIPIAADFNKLQPSLHPWKRRKIRSYIERYKAICKEQTREDCFGDPYFADAEPVKASIRKLLEYITPDQDGFTKRN